jgi:hypothetical protein
MTKSQAAAASNLELTITEAIKMIGPTHSAFAIIDGLRSAELSVEQLRYLSRELDRHADRIEREKNDAG